MKKSVSVPAILLAVAVIACGCSASSSAPAQAPSPGSAAPVSSSQAAPKPSYPTGPITMIIPTSAGGGYDLGARLVARYLPRYLPNKVEVVCENHSGGGQMIGVHYLYGSKSDGYTIGAFNAVGALLAQFIRGDEVTFEMEKFNFLGMWQNDVRAIAVNNTMDVKNWDELVALCNGGTTPLLAGAGGAGSGQHTDLVILDNISDLSFNYVQYDGSAQVEPAMGRNEIQFETAQVGTIVSLEEQGMGKGLCVFAEERDPSAPHLPTALEFGMPKDQFDLLVNLPIFGVYRTIAAPPGVDPEIVEILQEAIWKVFQDPEYLAELEAMGGINNPVHGKQLTLNIAAQIASVSNYPELIEALKVE